MANIILGVCSSISIYKSLELISLLKKDGHRVFPILTKNAQKLISPFLFQNLSGETVFQDMFDPANPNQMEHIRLAKLADIFVIAPASANAITRISLGLADDLLSTTLMAFDGPKLIFPAMNPTMWLNPLLQENVNKLIKIGYQVFKPTSGIVACGDEGVGKLEDVAVMAEHITKAFYAPLKGKKILITAGGSSEPLDPVRVLTNKSSGKMGSALANACQRLGAEVTFLYGNISVDLPKVSYLQTFSTTLDLDGKIKKLIPDMEVLIMAAAPGDFRVKSIEEQKIKSKESFSLELIKNPDILKGLSKKPNQIFIGFAAETEELLSRAKEKLMSKNLDMIVANIVGNSGVGIGGDETQITILDHAGVVLESQKITKINTAELIVTELIKRIK